MAQLEVGMKAPDFDLVDQTGRRRRLADYAGKPLILFFYPKANTSGCTAQACSVRDARGELEALGVAAIGISPDAADLQRKFDEKHALGFPLLADTEHVVCEAYGVWGEKTMYGKKYWGVVRSAFLIGSDGRVAAAFYKVSPQDTVPKLRAALETARSRSDALS
jgi:peroxiredoxin Q/BCP